MSERGYCKYCDKQVPISKMKKVKETYVHEGIKITRVWIGCVDCWDMLQKVS